MMCIKLSLKNEIIQEADKKCLPLFISLQQYNVGITKSKELWLEV